MQVEHKSLKKQNGNEYYENCTVLHSFYKYGMLTLYWPLLYLQLNLQNSVHQKTPIFDKFYSVCNADSAGMTGISNMVLKN